VDRRTIARLAPDERALVQLYYGSGRRVAEIAETLGLPAGTVKSRLYPVRETLKQMLKGNSHE
jgi:RNA polymerase sigma-70 factor (ECF subfamily)